MGKFSIIAIATALVGFASIAPAVAAGGMGDPSANTRKIQEICDQQRRGEYPRYFNACPAYLADSPLYYPDNSVRN